ncbi:MAG: hypothetical protein MR051_00570 [Lentisphaeria bacterium]|nr:hypothetical protein [Lentisphaeria bacterium]
MKRILYALVAGLGLVTSDLPAANVAVIYSSWPEGNKSYWEEFDSTLGKLGYGFQKFENTKIPELTRKLADFDMVAITSVGNLEHTVEMKPYAEAWKEYIKNGGMLFICDANYTSVLQSFVNHFGPEFALYAEHCTAHTKPSPRNKVSYTGNHPLLTFPAPAYETATTVGHWSHLTKLPRGWIALETCVDNKPITVAKPYGKGLIVVTVHSGLKDTASGPYAKDIFTNMAAFTALKKQGLSVVYAQMPSGIARNTALIRIVAERRDLARQVGLKVRYTVKNGVKETAAAAEVNGRTVTLKAPVDFDCRGAIAVETIITLRGEPVMAGSTLLQLPEYLGFKARRVHLYPDNPVLSLSFTAAPKDPGAKQTVRWNIDGGTAREIAVARNEFRHDFDVSSLALGKHILNMEFTENGKTVGSYALDFFRHDTPAIAVRADGTLTRKGKPFFPMGFYHVSRGLSLQSRMDMIRDIARYGYNCVHVAIKDEEAKTETYTEFLNECEQRGILVISEFGSDALAVIRRYKNHPAVLGWNPGDEPAGNGVTPEEMFRRYSGFKQEDPDHIAYTVICVAKQYKNYASGSDILAPDPYPIPDGHVDDVFKIYLSAYAEARKYGTTLWGVPQCFGNFASWTRVPTGREYRAMVYLAIMAGIKGFINYTYNDGGFFLPSNAELYEACKTFPAELKELIPFILDGKRTILRSNARGIYAAVWEMNGRRAYVVVNASDKELARPLSFRLPGDFKGCRVPVGKLDGMSASGTGLTATLAPMERVLIFCK